MKYIVYFILTTSWYGLFLFYSTTSYQQILVGTGYMMWLVIYFLYYMPIDKKYIKLIKGLT